MSTTQATPDSAFAPSWFQPPTASRSVTAPHSAAPGTTQLWPQLLQLRVLAALAVIGLQVLALSQGKGQPVLLGLCLMYGLLTGIVLLKPPPLQVNALWSSNWLLTVWLDLGVFAWLQTTPGGGINLTPLFVLPVLTAGLLGPLPLALGSAAAATLALLGDTAYRLWLAPLASPTPVLLQTGLTGTGLFLLAVLANQLALRLSREQALASRSQAEARLHSQVNELIVTGLSEGVLVVASDGTVWHANPAAHAMLGADPSSDLRTTSAWPLLWQWITPCWITGQPQEQELSVAVADRLQRKLRVRAKLTPAVDIDPRMCVLFIDDLREIEARIRTEKLAAMGRVSAAVAHEIRNPLAAITQANALLAEEDLPPTQKRLSTMIGHNALRLARTVDDILDITRVDTQATSVAPTLQPLDLLIERLTQDWQQTNSAGERVLLDLQAPCIHVRFESEHLQRVLTNLLDNANRYASANTASIQICTRYTPAIHSATLSVWSDGPPLDASVQQHLFEPFFSSNSRSSGLGLYICRELCQRYQASIRYRRSTKRQIEGNSFEVCLPMAYPTNTP